MDIPSSSPCNSTNNSSLKGYLYKIKNANNETISYLFGTIHDISEEDRPLLDKKIYRSLSRCQKLFLEINFLSEGHYIHYLNNHASFEEKQLVNHVMKEKNLSWEEACLEVAKSSVEEHKKNPTMVDTLIGVKAMELGIKIESLETVEIRKNAMDSVVDEFDDLNRKRQFICATAIKQASSCIAKFQEALMKGNLNEADSQLIEGVDFLQGAINNVRFKNIDKNDQAMISVIFPTIKLYEELYLMRGFDTKPLEALKILYVVRQDIEKVRLSRLRKAWKEGDEKIFTKLRETFTAVEKKEIDLTNKFVFFRDEPIVNRMHEELSQASISKRSFFAMGTSHCIGDYENVCKRLEKLGWGTESAYPSSS